MNIIEVFNKHKLLFLKFLFSPFSASLHLCARNMCFNRNMFYNHYECYDYEQLSPYV
jgi:hypothetical protein